MARRDDMVISPSLGDTGGTTAHERAQVQRRHERSPRRKHLLRRLREARRAKQMRSMHRARTIRRGSSLSRTGMRTAARGAVRAGASSGARAAGMANPIILGTLAALAVVYVGVKVATGVTNEQIGQDFNDMLLGDMDEEARANMIVRQQLRSNPGVAHLQGQYTRARLAEKKEDALHPQIAQIADNLRQMEMQRQLGITAIEREKPVKDTLDLMIEALAERIRRVWKELESDPRVKQILDYLRGSRAVYRGFKGARGLVEYFLDK